MVAGFAVVDVVAGAVVDVDEVGTAAAAVAPGGVGPAADAVAVEVAGAIEDAGTDTSSGAEPESFAAGAAGEPDPLEATLGRLGCEVGLAAAGGATPTCAACDGPPTGGSTVSSAAVSTGVSTTGGSTIGPSITDDVGAVSNPVGAVASPATANTSAAGAPSVGGGTRPQYASTTAKTSVVLIAIIGPLPRRGSAERRSMACDATDLATGLTGFGPSVHLPSGQRPSFRHPRLRDLAHQISPATDSIAMINTRA